MLSTFPRKKWTAEEVLRMVELGILDEDAPYELIDGELLEKHPTSPLDAFLVTRLRNRMTATYPDHLVLDGGPLATNAWSLPEPDVTVIPGDDTPFWERHPRGDEVLLALEVAVTSGQIDREKALHYARAGIAVYWLLDVKERKLLVHSDPRPTGYGLVTILDEWRDVSPPGSDVSWTVGSLLP